MTYLGAVIYGDGRADSEISRTIGAARADYYQLQKLWNHASVSVRDKLQFLHALIVSRLIYGLSTVWLVTAQRRRLDGFYARCLRRILRIPAAYVSRVSNTKVLLQAGVKPFSEQLLFRQLALLGKVARSPTENPLRKDTFVPGSVTPQIGRTMRRVGRPRQNWTEMLMKVGEARLGAAEHKRLLPDTSLGAQAR